MTIKATNWFKSQIVINIKPKTKNKSQKLKPKLQNSKSKIHRLENEFVYKNFVLFLQKEQPKDQKKCKIYMCVIEHMF